MSVILHIRVIMTSKLTNKHFIRFGMLNVVDKDTSFAFVAHLAPEIQHFLFPKKASAAILKMAL